MDQLIYYVPWDGFAIDTYLYGSQLSFPEERLVYLKNSMMAPGRTIKTWLSRTNFQTNRREPMLPVLMERGNYHVHALIQSVPEEAFVLRFDFFDQQQKLIDSFMHHGCDSDFTCPVGTFYYTMSLIEGGAKELWFHEVRIIPQSTYEKIPLYFGTIRNQVSGADVLNILLPQPQARSYRLFPEDTPWLVENLVMAPLEILAPGPFFSLKWLENKEYSRYTYHRYIGYGRESNAFAHTLEMKNDRSEAVTFTDLNDLRLHYCRKEVK